MARIVLDYEQMEDRSTEIFDCMTGKVLIRLPPRLGFAAEPIWHAWNITSKAIRRVTALWNHMKGQTHAG